MAYAYVLRLEAMSPRGTVLVTSRSAHRVLLVALVLAIKFLDDQYYSNGYYANVGGVELEELNELERRMLVGLDHRLWVEPDEIEELEADLTRTMQEREAMEQRMEQRIEEVTVAALRPFDLMAMGRSAAGQLLFEFDAPSRPYDDRDSAAAQRMGFEALLANSEHIDYSIVHESQNTMVRMRTVY